VAWHRLRPRPASLARAATPASDNAWSRRSRCCGTPPASGWRCSGPGPHPVALCQPVMAEAGAALRSLPEQLPGAPPPTPDDSRRAAGRLAAVRGGARTRPGARRRRSDPASFGGLLSLADSPSSRPGPGCGPWAAPGVGCASGAAAARTRSRPPLRHGPTSQ